MGIPFVSGEDGAPPAGDQANAVLAGTLTAIGPGASFAFYGGFNASVWGSRATTITTSAGSASATVASATGLAVGQSISSANVPAGSTIGALSGTSVTIALPAGKTVADITAGTAVAAAFGPVVTAATVQLERTFDGGATWLPVSVDGLGTPAVFTNPTGASVVGEEWERMVSYRFNCTAYSSGATVNYRISQTGSLATATGRP